MKVARYILFIAISFGIFSCNSENAPHQDGAEYYSAEDFYKVDKIDAHVHINTSDSFLLHLARLHGFRLLTINVGAPDYISLQDQQQIAQSHAAAHPDLVAFATSFDMNGFEDSQWIEKSRKYLERSFDQGAVGVKVWKHIGMELKDSQGNFIMVNHPRLDSIFKFIAAKNKTLIGHLGEPKNCWLPLDQMTVKNDIQYFSKHPEYHMYLHPEFPSYQDQIRARDQMLENNPGLRFHGAHLGSLEWSIDTLAEALDKFPDMAVDMAERVSHIQYQSQRDRQKVIDFFTKYQDRILYATDISMDEQSDTAKLRQYCEETWLGHWKYFTSDDMMQAPEIEGTFQALHLPKTVVDKIYYHNARRWFNGLFDASKN